MKKYVIMVLLALMTLACVTLEGLIDLPVQFVQVNGLLTILCAGAFISWTLKAHTDDFEKD